MTANDEEKLKELLWRMAPVQNPDFVRTTVRFDHWLSDQPFRAGARIYNGHTDVTMPKDIAELVVRAVNTAYDLLLEVSQLRAQHRAGTLAWAAASGRPFYRPCWFDLVCEQRKHDTTGLVAYPPARPEFWWYFRPSVHDVTATDYVLL